MEMLLRKDNRAYISFYNALIKEAYDDLAALLHSGLPRSSTDAHKGASSYGEKTVAAGGEGGGLKRLCCLCLGVHERWRKI